MMTSLDYTLSMMTMIALLLLAMSLIILLPLGAKYPPLLDSELNIATMEILYTNINFDMQVWQSLERAPNRVCVDLLIL